MIQSLRADDRILVRLPSWLGDMVMAQPALEALVNQVGPERVSIAGPEHLLPVFDGLFPGVRRIGHRGRGGEQTEAWRGHDVALLFTNSFRSAWVAARAGIKRRIGWSRDARGWLLSDALVPALERGAAPFGIGRVGGGRRCLPRPFGATCLELLGRLGISVSRTEPRLCASEEGERLAQRRLARHGVGAGDPYLLASVGARPGSAKAFPAASWATALQALLELEGDVPLFLAVGPGEESCLQEIQRISQHPSLIALLQPVAGLPELLALAAGARAALCCDGGPRHVIAASQTPLVCVMGPSDPRHTADHLEQQVLVRRELGCGPCHRERCSESGVDEHACMRGIDPLKLGTLLERLLQSPLG